MTYTKKYKEQIIKFLEYGHTIKETAEIFHIGTTTIKSWKKQLKETGSLENKHTRIQLPSKLPDVELMAYIEEYPDAYLAEIAAQFNCTDSAVSRACKRLGITRKKRRPPIKNVQKNNDKNT
ncbi:IS630 transposase-related protein [Bacillus thuringiensis]|uniref:IS630 transposase-related protein n=1 Tax=Bacillus cereus group TaxID=86661 RepID=UPI002960C706|nr:helix-turn-helix domain-containing protein [Bacillus cereus]HEF1879623.1 helix-turn-helix domain-containing protein [Bacillus cereus]HEF1885684.1 helix-turn-helix domain-containing protein [Bacillus cereus]